MIEAIPTRAWIELPEEITAVMLALMERAIWLLLSAPQLAFVIVLVASLFGSFWLALAVR